MNQQTQQPQTTGKKSKYAAKQEAMRKGTYAGPSPFWEDKEPETGQSQETEQPEEQSPQSDSVNK